MAENKDYNIEQKGLLLNDRIIAVCNLLIFIINIAQGQI